MQENRALLERVNLCLWILFFTGLIYSKFLCSISILCMVVITLQRMWRLGWMNLRMGISSSYWIFPLMGIFFMCALSGFYSEDLSDWIIRIRVKLPFLAIPFIYGFGYRLSSHHHTFLRSFILMLAVVSSVFVLVGYISDAKMYNAGIECGRVLSTPCHHVRYSLFLALSLIVGVEQLLKGGSNLGNFIWGLLLFYVYIAIHLMAVRTGITCVIVGLIYYLVVTYRGSLKKSIAVIATLLALSAFLFTTPSLARKVNYVKSDLSRLNTPISHDVSKLSDTRRVHSIRLGLEIFVENAIFGVGFGDLRSEMGKKSLENYDIDIEALPHNQYISILAGGGIVSLVIFVMSFYMPLRLFHGKAVGLKTVYLMISVSFMVENTIDSAIGTAIVLGFICIVGQKM